MSSLESWGRSWSFHFNWHGQVMVCCLLGNRRDRLSCAASFHFRPLHPLPNSLTQSGECRANAPARYLDVGKFGDLGLDASRRRRNSALRTSFATIQLSSLSTATGTISVLYAARESFSCALSNLPSLRAISVAPAPSPHSRNTSLAVARTAGP